MSTTLKTLDINAPGLNGINTQQISVEDPAWSVEADNAVIDDNGRLAARKGWTQVTSTAISGTPNIEQMHEYIDKTGTATLISCANNKIYTGTTSLTDVTGSLIITDNHWKFQNFNNVVVGFQSGHSPIVWTGSGNFVLISPSSGTTPTGNEVLAAFGRLWAISSDNDKTVIRYSDTLIYDVWDDHSSPGASGLLDLKTVWADGMDEIVALKEYNGFLVIFGKRTILVYSGASDPDTMTLVEQVSGIGCIARDTVQDVGTDLLFLSQSGIRSFQRTIQEKSMPITDISKNIRDEFRSFINSENVVDIKSVYHEPEGFYIINLPTAGKNYVFDIRYPLPDRTLRTTTWSGMAPKAMCSSRTGTLYLGFAGVVGQYSGYSDNTSSYDWSWLATWVSLTPDHTSRTKIPKKISALINGGHGYTLTFKVAYDYIQSYKTTTYTVPSYSGAAEFNIAEFNIAEFSNAITRSEAKSFLTGSGKTMQIGLSTTIQDVEFSLQRITLLIKLGSFA